MPLPANLSVDEIAIANKIAVKLSKVLDYAINLWDGPGGALGFRPIIGQAIGLTRTFLMDWLERTDYQKAVTKQASISELADMDWSNFPAHQEGTLRTASNGGATNTVDFLARRMTWKTKGILGAELAKPVRSSLSPGLTRANIQIATAIIDHALTSLKCKYAVEEPIAVSNTLSF